MSYFDRFDICEAHYALEIDYNVSGWLQERPSNRRRNEATHVQLERMRFKASPLFNGYQSLSENGREIYDELVQRYKLPVPERDNVIELTAPSAWASYLINGDDSGIDGSDKAQADAWIASVGHGEPVSCESAGFTAYHDAREFCPLAADCETYVFYKKESQT